MKPILLCSYIICLSSGVTAQQICPDSFGRTQATKIDEGVSTRERESRIIRYLSQLANNDQIAGAQLGFLDGTEIRFQSLLKSNSKSLDEQSAKQIFEIGSVTKVFTGLILSQLIESGKIRPHDPIEIYLPELKDLPAGKIKVLDLANHKSGLPRLPRNLKISNPTNPYATYTDQLLIEALKSENNVTATDKMNYSNYGAGVLGLIIKRIEGTDFEVSVKKWITEPLQMSDTTIATKEDSETVTGTNVFIESVPGWNFGSMQSAGALHSTVSDLSKFTSLFLSVPSSNPTPLQRAAQKMISRDLSGEVISWMKTQVNDNTVIWHNGGTGGFSSMVAFDPKTKFGVIALVNTANIDLSCIVSLMVGKECPTKIIVDMKKRELDSFKGKYESVDKVHKLELLTASNSLKLIVAGQEFRLFPTAKLKFEELQSGTGMQVEFHKSKKSFKFTMLNETTAFKKSKRPKP